VTGGSFLFMALAAKVRSQFGPVAGVGRIETFRGAFTGLIPAIRIPRWGMQCGIDYLHHPERWRNWDTQESTLPGGTQPIAFDSQALFALKTAYHAAR